MKFFTNKSIWTKIIIVLIFILVFEFVVSKPSLGAMDMLEFGGKLVSPIVSFVIALGDGVMEIVHSSIMGTSEALLQAEIGTDWWGIFCNVVGAIIAAAVAFAVLMIPGVGIGLAATVGIVSGMYSSSLLSDAFVDKEGASGATMSFGKDNLQTTMYLPAYSISPEEIFQGKIMLFNVDFFGEGKEIKEEYETVTDEDGEDIKDEDGNSIKGNIKYYYYEDENGKKVITSPQDLGQELSATISKWYVSLRNIGLVMMMIVLLYIGIRILLSTLASDKAKYKEMLKDWAIGMFLLFSVHYIMIFSNAIVNNITKVISSSIDSTNFYIQMEDNDDGGLEKFVKEAGYEDVVAKDMEGSNGNKVIVWPTNLMGSLRLKTQLTNWGSEFIGYGICFVIMVFFTLFFIFTYMKRVLYMAFLTLIAPVVAVTYPIDKISDGKAQGFDKWFKEYIFNLLLQPMHLLLYYVLITSAIELSSTNVLYSLVAMGFMIPAEKILRSFFGFEKAKTAGPLSGAAGLALGMQGMNAIKKLASGKDKKEEKVNASDTRGNIRQKDNVGVLDDGNAADKGHKEANIPDGKDSDTENNDLMGRSLGEIQKDEDEYNKLRQTASDENDTEEVQKIDDELEKLRMEREQIEQKEEAERLEQLEQEEAERLEKERKERENTRFTPDWWRKQRRQVGRYGKAIGHSTGRAVINGVRKAPGKTIRFTGKAVGAAGIATIGAAAGMATGSLDNTIKYGATATAAGYGIGGRISKEISRPLDNKIASKDKLIAPKTSYDKAKGESYDAYMEGKRAETKSMYREQLVNNVGEEKANELMKDGGIYDQCIDRGISNPQEVQLIDKFIDENKVNNVDEGVWTAKAAGKITDSKSAKKMEKKIAKRVKAQSEQDEIGITDAEVEKEAKRRIGNAQEFQKQIRKMRE